jgi:anti-anti-sigma regulatory factor
MQRAYQFISYAIKHDVFCVALQQPSLQDHQLEEFGAELARLVDEQNCRKMVLVLGPEEPECLYSVLLARLINLQRRLESAGGQLVLAHASDKVRQVFRTAGIEKFFPFFPDQQSALQALQTSA